MIPTESVSGMETGIEAPLKVLVQAASGGVPVGVDGATAAGDEIIRAVTALIESQGSITEALIDTQDRLAALRALIEVPVGSLDDGQALALMLTEARELTSSDCVVLVQDTKMLAVGDPAAASELSRQATGAAAHLGPATRPTRFPKGAAVLSAIDSADGRAVLGLARYGGPSYSTGDLQLIDAVVAATTKLLALTRIHRLGVQQAAIEREHQLASTLAQAVLPIEPPVLEGIELFATSVPASLAGGDFIAFEVVDGALWFAVGDVAGKGLPAAIVMTRAISAIRVAFHTHAENDPAGALAAVGTELFDYLNAVGLFVTMVLGVFRPGTEAALVCNAGHSPVLSWSGSRCAAVPPSMPPLGVVRGSRGHTQAVPLGVGDLVVLGSDGLVEQENAGGTIMGYERFEQSVAAHADLDITALGERLLADVAEFAEGTPPSDDRTLVLLRST